jgi:hypothetical protein
MSTTGGNKNLPSAEAHRPTRLRAVLHLYLGVRNTLARVRGRRLSGDPRQTIDAPETSRADAPPSGSHEPQREVVSLLIVHRGGAHPTYPRVDPSVAAGPAEGELVLELRRLIAWSAGTIADVAHALESRAADLDKTARELLQDEVVALEIDLAALRARLADPVDWDRELEYLLAGEVAPFDDLADDDEDDTDA